MNNEYKKIQGSISRRIEIVLSHRLQEEFAHSYSIALKNQAPFSII